jgi:YfiH family protein
VLLRAQLSEAPRQRTVIEAPPQLPILRVPQWRRVPGLVHGFCGRRGGSSRGVFGQLNLSCHVGDAADAVSENWRRVANAIGRGLRFATMKQVHSAQVVTLPCGATDAGEADAVVTRETGVALGVLTADCVPILLVADRHHVIGAVHAGWRGTIAGLAARTVEHLERDLGVQPPAVRAALGPAVGSCCYEVDRDIVERLEERWGPMPAAIRRDGDMRRRGKARLDLRRANAAILVRAGIRETGITIVGPCTGCAVTEYFSYRAVSTAASRGVTGRQLSFIAWQD